MHPRRRCHRASQALSRQIDVIPKNFKNTDPFEPSVHDVLERSDNAVIAASNIWTYVLPNARYQLFPLDCHVRRLLVFLGVRIENEAASSNAVDQFLLARTKRGPSVQHQAEQFVLASVIPGQ